MSDSKTINQDLLIATKGTMHAAETPTPTDLLYTEGKGKKVNHHNFIITAACDDAEATQKTFIRKQRIIHVGSRIGEDFGKNPSSYQGEFVGKGGGVYNGEVHHKHAKATKGSPNVIVEGQPLVRTDDPTEQNRNAKEKHNTNGKVKQLFGSFTEDELESLLDKGCTVESATATCEHGRTAATGRLEVLEWDVITLEMVLVNDAELDGAEARKKPKCQVPRRKKEGKLPKTAKVHPYFRVQRAAYPATSYREALPEIPAEEILGLKVELAEKWLGKKPEESSVQWVKPGSGGPDDDPSGNKRIAAASAATNTSRTTDTNATLTGARPSEAARMSTEQLRNPAATNEALSRGREEVIAQAQRDQESERLRAVVLTETQERNVSQQAAFDANAKSLEDAKEKANALFATGAVLLESWRGLKEVFLAKPVEIKIEALGCAGAKPLTIAAYPPKKYAADLLALKEVKTALKAVKELIAGVRTFLKLLGEDNVAEKEEGADAPAVSAEFTMKRFTVSISFLADAAASIWMEYRELERDATEQGENKALKKHEVKLAFGVDLAITKVIGIKFAYEVPATIALGPIGRGLQEVLDRVNIDSGVFVKFEIELAVGIGATIERDQYGKAWLGKSAAITPSLRFSISLIILISDSARFEIGAQCAWEPSFKVTASSDKPLEIVRDPGSIDITWFYKLDINILGWTIPLEGGGEIAKYPITGGPIVIE